MEQRSWIVDKEGLGAEEGHQQGASFFVECEGGLGGLGGRFLVAVSMGGACLV